MSTQHEAQQTVVGKAPQGAQAPVGKRRLPPGRERRLALIEAKLRSERVEQKLRQMPGWTRSPGRAPAVARAREFTNVGVAAAFATYVALAADAARQPFEVYLYGTQVLVTIYGEKGRKGGVTDAALELAKQLG